MACQELIGRNCVTTSSSRQALAALYSTAAEDIIDGGRLCYDNVEASQ